MLKRTYLLATAVVFIGACDSVTHTEDQLTEEEAQFLADLTDATAVGLLNDFFDASTSDPAGAPALTHEPVVWTRAFERSRPCHDGGTLTVAGSGTSVWNREDVAYDVESSGTKSRTDCAVARDDVIITRNGNAAWTHERHYRDYIPTGTWITTYVGGFDWTKSTGESGSCFYELTRTVDTEENARTLTGTFCGDEVNRAETWR